MQQRTDNAMNTFLVRCGKKGGGKRGGREGGGRLRRKGAANNIPSFLPSFLSSSISRSRLQSNEEGEGGGGYFSHFHVVRPQHPQPQQPIIDGPPPLTSL